VSTSVRAFRNDKSRRVEAKGRTGEGLGCQAISLLTFLEDENRELRKAVLDLALDALLLKTSRRHSNR
jgi:hypothetical protein